MNFWGRCVIFGPEHARMQTAMPTAATNMIINADHEMVAFKYIPCSTSPIVSCDFYMDITGTVTGIDLTLEMQSNTAGTTELLDIPSGTVLGATNNCKVAAFAGPAADGWSGTKTFTEHTGNLTIGEPIWLIIQGHNNSGTLDGSNYINLCRTSNTVGYWNVIRHHDGTNWTNTTAVQYQGAVILTHDDGSMGLGHASTALSGSSGYTDIYGANRQAIKVRFGSKVKVAGIQNFNVTATGTPETLQLSVYKGNSLVYGPTNTRITATRSGQNNVMLTSAVTCDEDSDYYFVFSQTGTSDSNDYDILCLKYNSTYHKAATWENFVFCYGSGTDPTAYTVVEDRIPPCLFILDDPVNSLDVPTAGGSSPRFGDMTGGLR